MELTIQEIDRIENFRKNIIKLEQHLSDLPDSIGDIKNAGQDESFNKVYPLKHKFVGGLYRREMFMPKGNFIMSGIHKKDHVFFLIKGDLSVLSEDGIQRIKAPFDTVTKSGTKRLVYVHEDSVAVTIHATEKNNVEDVTNEVIAKDFNDPDISIENMKKNLELKNKQ